jgi:hypothetical protein
MNKSMWNAEAVKAYESGQGVVLVEKPYLHYEPLKEKQHDKNTQGIESKPYAKRKDLIARKRYQVKGQLKWQLTK